MDVWREMKGNDSTGERRNERMGEVRDARRKKIDEVYDGNLLPKKKSVVQKCKNG